MLSAHLASVEISFFTGCILVAVLLALGAFGALLIRSMFAGARRDIARKQAPPTKHVDAWALAGSRFGVDPARSSAFPPGFPDSGDSDSSGSSSGRDAHWWGDASGSTGSSSDASDGSSDSGSGGSSDGASDGSWDGGSGGGDGGGSGGGCG